MSWTKQTASNKGSDKKFEVPPPGSHAANLVAIIDLGTQHTDYQGVHDKKHQVFLVWELCHEIEAGTTNRHVIGKTYTLSSHKKGALRQMLETWRGQVYAEGQEYDLDATLGKACLLTITHTPPDPEGKTYAKLEGVSGLPRGMTALPPQRTPISQPWTNADPLPDWLPYIYGEKPGDVLARCDELHRKDAPAPAPNGKHTSQDANKAYPPQQQQMAATGSDIPF